MKSALWTIQNNRVQSEGHAVETKTIQTLWTNFGTITSFHQNIAYNNH